jgi:hypothetical protein
MRMMLKFTLPVEKGNAAFRDGSLARVLESIMNKLKPEAAYFGVEWFSSISAIRRRLSKL